ncbi:MULTISPECIES: hypothetical protein [unclassified Streptomyces]|uniref:hypothetical protein n=1 Tax=unclassified Streptomyces TaxID=2593676 RepID=UPI00225B2120|nr:MULTISPECIES: hypothetical protein [unclassified Streptomyces]MCX4629119.1 hypothetical protein [Streptomyces sp. NBC_01443]WSW45156.1 hypothetical protein OG296_19635 [Streptomyces sp. NBC_01001]
MAIADDLKKTLTDPTPLYFAAGTADLAVQQAKKVPGLIEQLRAEAPARIEAVKNTDPKIVQEKAREAQEAVTAKFAEVLTAIDPKKLGETAQDLALRGVGVAAEYAVRAKETYDKVAEHGEQAVRTWRGEVSEEIVDIAVAVEPKQEPAEAPAADASAGAAGSDEEKPAARKAAVRRNNTKKAAAMAGDES